MKDTKYIIRRVVSGVLIGCILMTIRSCNVKAQSIDVTFSGVYTYEKDSNTNSNQTNNTTTITSGTATWYKTPKNRYRLRYLANSSLLETGTYDVVFSTFNEDRAVYNGYIQVGYDAFACESYNDLYISYPNYPDQGGDQIDLSSGSQTFICRNVKILSTQAFNIFLNGVVGASTNHYTYISKRMNWIPVSDVSQSISDASQQAHQDAQQAHQDAQNINNSINNSSTPSGTATESAYTGFESNLATNGVITQLVVLPVSLFRNVLNGLNSTCTRFDLGTLMGTHIYFDCINVSNYFGTQLWGVIDVLMSGFFIWYIARKLIKVFENLSSMKEGDPIGD